MVIKEFAVERFRFTCAHCAHAWVVDYDVQHVQDHGHDCDYFYRDGLPALAPTGRGALSCPACGATRLYVRLLARRAIPAHTPADTETALGSRPSAFRAAERRKAPLLPAGGQPHQPAPEGGHAAPREAELVDPTDTTATDTTATDRARA